MKKQNKVVFFNLLSTVLLQGLSVITAPLFSRLLGPDGYGVVSIYMIWVNAFQIAFTLNTYATIVNARVEYPAEQQNAYHSSVMGLSLLFFAGCSFLVLLFLKPLSALLKLPTGVLILMLVHVLMGYSMNFLHTKFTHEFRADWNCYISLASALMIVGLSVLLIGWLPPEQDYYGRIGALVITNSVFGIGALAYVLGKGKQLYNKTYWVFCLSLCLPLVFYNLSDLILGYTDRLMLQHMMSESMVGQYSLASSFGGIMFTIFCALNNSWVPFFFDDYKQGRTEHLNAQAKNFLEVFTVLSVGFVLLTREVYHVFASRDFWPGTDMIPFFVTSYYLNFLCTFPVNVEYYYKKTKVVALVTIVAAAVNMGLNFVLIQSLGAVGAAVSTAVSHGVQLTLHYCYARFVAGDSYPFLLRLWGGYAVCFLLALAAFWLLPELWWVRWLLGAAIGIWELLRIRRRKVLI